MNILYPIIDGEITGGNMICLRIIEESLKKGYGAVVNSPTEGKFTYLLREKGIRVYNIDTRRTFRFDSAIKLARIIKKENIKLVHSHAPLAGTILSRLGGWIAGVPVINHAHTPDFMNLNLIVRSYQFLINWITSRLFCIKVIAVSEFVKREIIKQGILVDKIVVIYNGIDTGIADYKISPVKIREEFGLRHDQYIVGEIGRLDESKGQEVLIKAAQKVTERFSDTIFMLVGEDLRYKGEYKKRLEKPVSDLGLKQKIIFTGYRADIMELMDAFDVFVLPSTHTEGLPVVILEAMAAKKAVITTSIGGNTEIVLDGQTGTIIPPKDPNKLAEAILYHLSNPEISRQMGEKGYKRVKQFFSLSEMLGKVMDIYKEVSGIRSWPL